MAHRHALAALAAFATAGLVLTAVPASADGGRRPAKTLGELAAAKDRYFGAATDVVGLADAEYARQLAHEFNSTTAGNELKWYATEPQQGVFDFTLGDQVVHFARKNNMVFRGHTLMWHNQLPDWLTNGAWTADQLRAILKNHITQEVRHYRGKAYSWDVVNEPFNEDGTYRDTIFYRILGPGYIADAFRWAHEADPHAKLYLNDYNVEYIGPKSDAYHALVKSLKAEGVPIHGMGFQGHLALQYGYPTTLQENLQRFADLGVDVAITELDIRMLLPATDDKLATQAKWYADVTKACLAVRRCVGITLWGHTDKYSWIPAFFPGEGAALPYDENLNPKPAYYAIRDALSQ
ncbi:endo-1,4-beta-xylanase [Nonomuraea sp. CA-141351]|uniref:endo-1,4-beta-xylanase n=1 Tax=Nonomuraea sp. CA-141351 TaxID=3239996 RepID=UPI003D9063F5